MALDHYISQVYLKNFYSNDLGPLMHAIKKSDLEYFIKRCDIHQKKKDVLHARLNGLSSANNDNLNEHQIETIFEGMPHLLEKFLEINNEK